MSRAPQVLFVLALSGAALLTTLGLLADWLPFLDLINDGLPYLIAGCLLLAMLALVLRRRLLIAAAALLAMVNGAALYFDWQHESPAASPGSARFLRVATFNLMERNERMDDVAKFLAGSDADVIVLEETTRPHLAKLRQALSARYPYVVGDWSIVMLSKYPILAEGRVDPPGYPPWVSPMARWARIEVKGVLIEIAGVHLVRPFHPILQDQDYAALAAFVRRRTLPLVVAGDFNAAPWTVRFRDLARSTGLSPHNTLHPTWPLALRDFPLLPLVPTDNVGTSREFTALGAESGPRLGSDHRPFIADIALTALPHLPALLEGRPRGDPGIPIRISGRVCVTGGQGRPQQASRQARAGRPAIDTLLRRLSWHRSCTSVGLIQKDTPACPGEPSRN